MEILKMRQKTSIIYMHKSEQYTKLFHLNNKILNASGLDYKFSISTETTKMNLSINHHPKTKIKQMIK